jgi:hypothetical protein
MSKKMIFAALITLAFSFNASAAMSRVDAELKVKSSHASEQKATEDFQKELDRAGGDLSKMDRTIRMNFVSAMNSFSGKYGIKSTSLQRLVAVKSDALADVVRLKASLESKDAKEADAAKTQLELMERIGSKLTAENKKATETQAAIKLLSLDLLTLPAKATEVVKAVNLNISQGKSISDSVKEGTKGMKGTLEDLITCV